MTDAAQAQAEMETRTGFVTIRDCGWAAGAERFVCHFVAWDYDRKAQHARQAKDEFSLDLRAFASRRDAQRFSLSHPKTAAWVAPH